MTCDYEAGYCCRNELEKSRHVVEMPRTLFMNKDTSMDQQHVVCAVRLCEDHSPQKVLLDL